MGYFSRLCMRGEGGDRVYLLFVDDTLVFYERHLRIK